MTVTSFPLHKFDLSTVDMFWHSYYTPLIFITGIKLLSFLFLLASATIFAWCNCHLIGTDSPILNVDVPIPIGYGRPVAVRATRDSSAV